VAVRNLLPVELELLVAEPPPVVAAGAVEADHVEEFDVAMDSNDTGIPAQPAPLLLGPLALQSHQQELHALLEKFLGALDQQDTSMQHRALLCNRRLCLCGHEMRAFQQPAQPMS
jgi:hypothetical protein